MVSSKSKAKQHAKTEKDLYADMDALREELAALLLKNEVRFYVTRSCGVIGYK